MPNTKSAIKRVKVEAKRRANNHAIKTKVRTFVVKARRAMEANADEPETLEAVRQAISQLDRAVTKGVLHRNNASRRKSRLVHRLKALTGETDAAE